MPPLDPYQAAMKLLSYRWRSEAELRQRLAKRGVSEAEIDGVIRRLAEEGWVDDERFAREFVRSRARRHGRRRIGIDLHRLGVGRDEASSALSEELSQQVEDEILLDLARKRVAVLARRHGNDYPSSEVGRRNLVRFLLQRGYPATAVRKVVFDLTGDTGEGE